MPDVPRGRHKIFLGMVAGVGKTFRMLQEGRAEAEAGRDVVIGYLEPHGRVETVAQATGLEVVPRRRIEYRGTALEEMSLPGILARAPELCLVDELAHTNAPGVENTKRFADVEDILDGGIDVFSTVNVQHLESLNDQVTELTGARVRETLPDRILASADEVVLIDLTPEALIQRLREGRIYAPERVEGALNNFFKIENLQALRELALRQVAEEVEHKRLIKEIVGSRDDLGADATQAVGERLLALVKPRPQSQRLVRRAWRSAQRLGAQLDLLWVKPDDREPSDEEAEQVAALRRLAAVLGAHFVVEEGDLADVVERVARDRGTTYILVGAPSQRAGLRRFAEPLPLKLIRRLPGVDVRIVADRAQREVQEP
jgi:two-component system sensor histidine kinase KdpD